MNQTVGTIKQLNVVEITQKNILVQFRCHHTVFSSILNIDRHTTHNSIGWVLSISGSCFCMTGSSYLSGVKIVSSQQRVARRSLIPDSWVSTVHWAETKKKTQLRWRRIRTHNYSSKEAKPHSPNIGATFIEYANEIVCLLNLREFMNLTPFTVFS